MAGVVEGEMRDFLNASDPVNRLLNTDCFDFPSKVCVLSEFQQRRNSMLSTSKPWNIESLTHKEFNQMIANIELLGIYSILPPNLPTGKKDIVNGILFETESMAARESFDAISKVDQWFECSDTYLIWIYLLVTNLEFKNHSQKLVPMLFEHLIIIEDRTLFRCKKS